MSLLRNSLHVVTLLTMVTLVAGRVAAQHGGYGEDHDAFYDPICDYEIDWFDPLACDCDDPDPWVPNSGWFCTYDRMILNASRPDEGAPLEFAPSFNFIGVIPGNLSAQQASDVDGDWAWGNRFDIGYTGADGNGLWVVIRKLDNPDVQLLDPNVNRNGVEQADLLGDPIGPTFITLNSFNVYGIEVNRVWRSVTLGRSVVVEPYAGPRYVRVRDHSDRADFFSERPGVPTTGPANGTLTFINDDQYREQDVTTDNDLYGGQFGLRTQWQRGRWLVSSDIRGFVFHNFRDRSQVVSEQINTQTITGTYDANGVLQNITLGPVNLGSSSDEITDESGRFAYGGELRLETMFEITKGFALRGAAEMVVFADGIGRGFTGTNESFSLLGFTFGFALNR